MKYDVNPQQQRIITLRHLVINNQKAIGLQFYPNKVIQAVIKQLENPRWSKKHEMVFVKNNKENLDEIFSKFKGVAYINGKYFFHNKPIKTFNEELNIAKFRNRKPIKGRRFVPTEFLDKLEIRRYSLKTAQIYITHFENFINYYSELPLLDINEAEIQKYLAKLFQEGKSNSYVNQAINAIKFYYEIVVDMPSRFYSIDRPMKQEKLPSVLSKQDVFKMIELTKNIKHRCIISLLYSSGLRRGELLNLKVQDVDSSRMVINVIEGKGEKDRITLLSTNLLQELRVYYKSHKPKKFLFENRDGVPYSASSVGKIIKKAAKAAGIRKRVTPHTLRHSFATHILESGTDIRYIKDLLGHNSLRTTEVYTHVATNSFENIKNPLDLKV